MGPLAHAAGWLALLATAWLVWVLVKRQPVVAGPLLIGWLCRQAFCIYNTYVVTFNVDGFEGWAADMSDQGVLDILSSWGNAETYTAFCALIYKVGGRNPMLLQEINIVFWALILTAIPGLAHYCNARKAVALVAWLYAVIPSSIYFSTVILRESFCTIGVVYGSLYFLRASSSFSVKDYFLCGTWFLFASMIHYGCIVLLLAVIVSSGLIVRRRSALDGMKRIWFRFGVLFISMVLCVALFRFGLFDRLAPRFSTDEITVAAMSGSSEASFERGRTDYTVGLYTESFAGLLLTAPLRFILFLVSPLPWMIRKIIDLVAFVDAISYTVAIWWIWSARRQLFNDRRIVALLFITGTGLFVFAMGTINFGTAVRHRAKFFPVVMTLACAGRELMKRREQGGNRPRFSSEMVLGPARQRRLVQRALRSGTGGLSE